MVAEPAVQAPKKVLKNSLIEEEKKKSLEITEIKEVKEEEEEMKDEKKKTTKPKPIMVDAWTQTERSDYSIIKSRMLSH